MKIRKSLAIADLTLAMSAGTAVAETPVSGTWRLKDGKVTVRVSECGKKLCGTIIAMAKPLDKNGKPQRDKHNPNPALRHREVVGLTILAGLKPKGEDSWAGSIYNPNDGKTYKTEVKLVSPAKMKVKGCVAVVCKSMEFNRVN